ncbi:MAG: hypothetical protein ACXWQQ_06065 [Pseudobdellovibrio sp.]
MMKKFNKVKKINSDRIEKAVDDFESKVEFEFIPVIADKSSYDGHIVWLLSLLFLFVFIGLIDWLMNVYLADSWTPKEYLYLAAPVLAYLCAFLLDNSDYIDRFFISKRERTRQVHEKAELVFYRKRLHELKSHNALMLYISVMERQIVLLPDPHMKFEHIKEINHELLKILQHSFKNSDFEEGLVSAIEHLKKRLAPHFSKKEASTNNYPNKLIWIQE